MEKGTFYQNHNFFPKKLVLITNREDAIVHD